MLYRHTGRRTLRQAKLFKINAKLHYYDTGAGQARVEWCSGAGADSALNQTPR